MGLGRKSYLGLAESHFLFIALAKIPEREESISPSNFYGEQPDY